MARSTVVVKVTFNRFPEIAAAMPERTRRVVQKTGHDIEAGAKQRVRVDTGALKNSITTEEEDGGLTAIVAPHTDYAIFQEFGPAANAQGRQWSFTPYMTPAAEVERPRFVAAMKQMLQDL